MRIYKVARHKGRQRYVSKYADEAVLVVGKKVLKIEEQNTEINDKMKTVFYCESTKLEGRMCIVWGRTDFKVGDVVDMKGRVKDDVFLVWSLMFKRLEENEQ